VSRYRIVIVDNRYEAYQEEQKTLKEIKADVEICNPKSEEEALERVREADGVLINLHQMPAEIIRGMTRCRVISRYGVGYDNVDVDAATARGIWVANVPDYAMEDVSDQALALLLACVRKIAFKDRRVREGGWNLSAEQPSYRIRGKVLGLVGYGGIARALHRKASSLGLARVLAYDPYLPSDSIRRSGAEPVDLPTLLGQADYISVHAPLSEETRGLIGREEFAQMKATAILVNTARGPIVDEKALCDALTERRIQAAGIDVFEVEPLPASSPLTSLDNIVLSDHAGWYSEESLVELKTKTARNVVSVFQKGEPDYPVNRVPTDR